MSTPLPSETPRRRPDGAAMLIGVALLLIAGIVAFDVSHIGAVASYARIGPQTIPYIISGCLVVLGLWTLVEAWRGDFPEREPQELKPVLFIVVALLVQIALLKVVGFSVATGLMFAITARGIGRVSVPLAIVGGIIGSALVWFLFARILQLTLPAGPPEQWMLNLADMVAGAFRPAATGP